MYVSKPLRSRKMETDIELGVQNLIALSFSASYCFYAQFRWGLSYLLRRSVVYCSPCIKNVVIIVMAEGCGNIVNISHLLYTVVHICQSRDHPHVLSFGNFSKLLPGCDSQGHN